MLLERWTWLLCLPHTPKECAVTRFWELEVSKVQKYTVWGIDYILICYLGERQSQRVNHGSIYEIIHNLLHFHKVCVRLVLKTFTKQHRSDHVRQTTFWAIIKQKVIPQCTAPSCWQNMDPTLMSFIINVRAWNRNTSHPAKSKKLKPQPTATNMMLRFSRTNRCALLWTGFASQPKTFFSEGILKLVKCFNKC